MLRDLVTNIFLLTTSFFLLGCIYKSPLFAIQSSPRSTKLLLGVLLGLLGLLLMAFSFRIAPAAFVDLRHLPVLIGAIYGGPLAAMVSSAVIAAGRVVFFESDLPALLVSALVILGTGGVSSMISKTRLSPVCQFVAMMAASLIFISLAINYMVPDKAAALELIGYYWLITIPSGGLVWLVVRYIFTSNEAIYRLEQGEERYKQLMLSSPDAILVHADGVIRFINQRGLDLLGAESFEDMLDKPILDFVYTPQIERAKERFAHVLRTQRPLSAVEDRLVRLDGTIVDVELSTTPITYQNKPAIMTTLRDITDRKATEQKLQEALTALQRLSHMDGLTGVANRRSFDEQIEAEWLQAAFESKHLSLIMFDVDYFKLYNDRYGHQNGDDCLKAIASAVKEMFDGSNRFLARYGGEEFTVILPDTGRHTTFAIAESIRKKIESLQLPHEVSDASPYVTVSLGAASVVPASPTGPKELVAMADKALYKAKSEGRNRVSAFK